MGRVCPGFQAQPGCLWWEEPEVGRSQLGGVGGGPGSEGSVRGWGSCGDFVAPDCEGPARPLGFAGQPLRPGSLVPREVAWALASVLKTWGICRPEWDLGIQGCRQLLGRD